MYVLPRHAISGAKGADALAQRALLSLQALDVTFAGSKLGQEAFDQCGNRCVLLSGFYARPTVGLIIHSYCDIFHISTVSQLDLASRKIQFPSSDCQ
jgi:hypothetical protein